MDAELEQAKERIKTLEALVQTLIENVGNSNARVTSLEALNASLLSEIAGANARLSGLEVAFFSHNEVERPSAT